MKKVIIILMMLIIASCNRSMDSWPTEEENGKDVNVYIRTRAFPGANTPPSIYQFFIYDNIKEIVTSHNVNTSNSKPLQLKLLPGTYTGYCITNANNAEAWEYSENNPPSKIYLNSDENTSDHLLGSTTFEVKESELKNAATFNLERKVAMLKVIISNIPENLSDLKINVSDIPEKISLTGEYSTGAHTISKSIAQPTVNKISETSIFLFPPQKDKATISLSSAYLQFITIEHTIDTILVNHVTEINVKLWANKDVPEIDITSTIVKWDDKIIKEDDWEVIVPDGPCEGIGSGENLVQNGSLDSITSGTVPLHWELDVSGSYTPKTTWVTSPIHTGSKAIMLSPKTYLTQTINIVGGQCYEFKAYVNSLNEDVEWAVWGTWKKGSSDLTSQSGIIRTAQQKKTDGYIDAYQGKIFRAPATATKLFIEIKNYSEVGVTEGLYIDDVSIKLVE